MKTVIVDYRIDSTEKSKLEELGYKILFCPKNNNLIEAISGHPDMSLHIVSSNIIVAAENINNEMKNALKLLNYKIISCKKEPEVKYPYDISLNALNMKDFFVHNLKYTDENLLSNIDNKKLINVKQGYSKCSTAIVSPMAIITCDLGISSALENEGVDVLLLPPGDIVLPGFEYGFIGGCCGLLEENILAFFGDLHYYKYGELILAFLEKHAVEAIFLRQGRLIDRGTLFRL